MNATQPTEAMQRWRAQQEMLVMSDPTTGSLTSKLEKVICMWVLGSGQRHPERRDIMNGILFHFRPRAILGQFFQQRRHINGKNKQKKIDDLKAGVLNRAAKNLESWTGRNWIHSEKVLPQEEKISNALFALLKTEVPEGSPLALYKSALRFIVIGWNFSLLDTDARSKALQKFAADIKQPDEAIRHATLSHMVKVIAKKHALFPRDKRFVVSYDVWLEGDLMRVTAAAVDLAA